jgi:hypothetical protein
MPNVTVRFDIFVTSAKAYEMSGYMLGYSAGARCRRVARKANAKLFRAPSFMSAGEGTFRQPRPFADDQAGRAIETATSCYVVEYKGERADSLWYLDAALKLAEDIAKQCKGFVVDRTSDTFFPKRALAKLRKGVSPRDTVALREVLNKTKTTVTLATEGMSKYGQQDFVLRAFPADLAEMGRRLLYDNLCSYAMGQVVRAGETFGGRAVRMIFVRDTRNRLEVRDVHPEKKKALSGTKHLVEALRPLWAEQMAAER